MNAPRDILGQGDYGFERPRNVLQTPLGGLACFILLGIWIVLLVYILRRSGVLRWWFVGAIGLAFAMPTLGGEPAGGVGGAYFFTVIGAIVTLLAGRRPAACARCGQTFLGRFCGRCGAKNPQMFRRAEHPTLIKRA